VAAPQRNPGGKARREVFGEEEVVRALGIVGSATQTLRDSPQKVKPSDRGENEGKNISRLFSQPRS